MVGNSGVCSAVSVLREAKTRGEHRNQEFPSRTVAVQLQIPCTGANGPKPASA